MSGGLLKQYLFGGEGSSPLIFSGAFLLVITGLIFAFQKMVKRVGMIWGAILSIVFPFLGCALFIFVLGVFEMVTRSPEVNSEPFPFGYMLAGPVYLAIVYWPVVVLMTVITNFVTWKILKVEERRSAPVTTISEPNKIYQNLDILLITAPPWGMHNPPLGLAYLSSYLRSNGISVAVFDFNISIYRRIKPSLHKLWLPEYKNWWSNPDLFRELSLKFSKDIEWAVEQILAYNAPVIGFSVVDPKERITIEIIQKVLAKAPSKKIILGGPAVSTPEQRKIFIDHLGNSIDFCVLYEGEKILLDLMQHYKGEGPAIFAESAERPLIVQKAIDDLSELPHPTYDDFDFSMYDGGSLIVEWSRGCISSCAYCKGRQVQDKYRMKKAEYIVAELEYHYNRYNIKYFVICDNLLNGKVKELERVCDLLISKKIPINWEGQGIPYKKMTSLLLNKMKAAGCSKLQWGLESGSDKVLQNIRKGKIFTVKEAEEVIRFSHGAGIRTELFIIVGLPGEDENEFNKTKAFLIRNKNYIDLIKSINTLHLVHGTDLFDNAHEYGLCLPQKCEHYLWYSKDGNNNYNHRIKRAKSLIKLAGEIGIQVQEHNLFEGNERELTIL